MKKFTFLLLFILCLMPVQNTQAIGVWLEGRLDAAPWQEQGHFQLVIDGVRYTVMNEVDVKLVTTEKGMVLKNHAEVRHLHAGDTLAVQYSNNRIYAIEVKR